MDFGCAWRLGQDPRPAATRIPDKCAVTHSTVQHRSGTFEPLPESPSGLIASINARLASVHRVLALRVDTQRAMPIMEATETPSGRVPDVVPSSDLQHLSNMLSSREAGRNIRLDAPT